MTRLREVRRSSPCPCSSGALYRDCCAPFHAGQREPGSAVLLMRSRYSAFAAGEIEHLVRTLHPDHPDRAMPIEVLRSTLQATSRAYRYTGLVVEESEEEGEHATVLFLARLFDRGTDRSFRERSAFVKTSEGWRYLSGETLPTSR